MCALRRGRFAFPLAFRCTILCMALSLVRSSHSLVTVYQPSWCRRTGEVFRYISFIFSLLWIAEANQIPNCLDDLIFLRLFICSMEWWKSLRICVCFYLCEFLKFSPFWLSHMWILLILVSDNFVLPSISSDIDTWCKNKIVHLICSKRHPLVATCCQNETKTNTIEIGLQQHKMKDVQTKKFKIDFDNNRMRC